MKIAHVAASSLPGSVGGLQIVVDNLIRQQRKMGHDACLITRWKSAKQAKTSGIDYPVFSLPPNFLLGSTPFREIGPRLPVEAAIGWHQLRQGFDLVHVHFVYPMAWLLHRVLRQLNVPMVVTAHGGDINYDRATNFGYRQFPKNDRRIQALAPKLGAVTAITDSMADTLRDIGVLERAIHRIDNGIDFFRFDKRRQLATSCRASLGIPDDAILILSVGRNQASKGFEIAPKVMTKLLDEGRNAYWVIAGTGVESLRNDFANSNVGERIVLKDSSHFDDSTKYPPDPLIDLFVAADIFAFPSHSEGMGLVALEAMAAGTPVVGNNVSGIADIISHGEDGLLVEPHNPEAMTDAIGRLIDEPELRENVIQAGLTKAAGNDWSNIVDHYLELYQAMIEPRP